jgi:hypothetical protein
MRKSLALAVTAAMTTGLVAFIPAVADAASSNTTVTFNLVGGTLSIAAPASVSLADVASSTTASTETGQLGSTTVTDTRGSLVGVYTVAVTSSNFTTGAAGPTQTILGSTVTAFSGPATFTNTSAGSVHVTTTAPVAAAGVVPIEGNSAYSGNDSSSYNPTITIPVPATNVAGTYTGTITQTVT